MTPSEQCKQAGLKNLNELSELTTVSVRTLQNWHENKPMLFEVVIYGALHIKK